MQEPKQPQQVGLWPMIALVTGNLVGSGVYLLPTILAPFGVISLLGWGVTSVGAILLALVFAQLSMRIATSGGPYVYVREAFGDTIGYYIAWGYWLLSCISNPTLAISAVEYCSILFGEFSPGMALLVEGIIIGCFNLFNLFGIKVAGRLELCITALKIIPLVLLPIVGFFYIQPSHFCLPTAEHLPLLTTINTTAFITLWAFVGLETGTVPASQVKNARTTIPRATVLGTILAAVVYILGTVMIMGVIPMEALATSKSPYADAASVIFGGTWAMPITIAAIITCLGTLNGWTLVVGYIPYGAAQSGLFPKVFAKTASQGTPYMGILLSVICIIPFLLMALTDALLVQFQLITDMAVTLILIVYAVAVLAYFKILLKRKNYHRGHILLGIGAFAFVGWALWATSVKIMLLSLTLFVLGIPMHLYMLRVHKRKKQDLA